MPKSNKKHMLMHLNLTKIKFKISINSNDKINKL